MVHMSPEAKERLRERDRLKKKRKRAKLKAAKTGKIPVLPGTSKTSKVYRNMLGPAPEMSKTQMRAAIAEAVRNTQAMDATSNG